VVNRLTYFNISRSGPPGRRTNRPTWQVPGCQAAHSVPDHHHHHHHHHLSRSHDTGQNVLYCMHWLQLSIGLDDIDNS